jgi:hypothetical protein
MPWTSKQKRVAQAVAHGWKPKGKAKDFGRDLADLILRETKDKKPKK